MCSLDGLLALAVYIACCTLMVANDKNTGTYALGHKCFECKAGGDCRNGGSEILPKPGFWRGPPYFQTCIDDNTLEVLNSSGSAYNFDARSSSHRCPNGTVPVTTLASLAAGGAASAATSVTLPACSDSSSLSGRPGQKGQQSKSKLAKKPCSAASPGKSFPSPFLSKHTGEASIFRCPGREMACPDRGGDAKGTSLECGKGYQGVACAICSPGFAPAGHECISCGKGTDHKKWVVIAAVSFGAVLAYYKLLAKGMCTSRKSSPGCMVQVKNAMPLFWLSRKFNMLSTLAKNKFAPSMLKFHDRTIFYRDMVKILVNFVQIVGSFARIDVNFPSEFRSVLAVFTVAEFNIDLPSTACMLSGVSFYNKLLGYIFLPFVIVCVMALPSIYAKLTKHQAQDSALDRFLVWALILVNLLYPSVLSLSLSMHALQLESWCLDRSGPVLTSVCLLQVSRVVFASLSCTDLDELGSFLAVDYRVDCNTDAYRAYRIVSFVAIGLW